MLLTRSDLAAAPEEGQLVSVRDRHWIVKSVTPSSLPPDVMTSNYAPQHLVELANVEDDGLGDEMSIIWEIEPGTRILETANLPRPIAGKFDDPARLKTFVDAVRWGAVASADSEALQAPFRSGIAIEDYQLDPVVRALSMARVNLMIADDVGLGKTIEAGLIAQEMILRHRVRSVMILCPPSLCLKWQAEMQEKFGLEFRIVDSEGVRLLRRERGVQANIFAHFPRLIVSFDWLKMERPMRILRDYLPADRNSYPRKIDLLIVDEVHQCAPAGNGNHYGTDSQRTELLRYLGPHAEHRLFLSATPHNGYENSFYALLELLDPQRFARGVKPDPKAIQNAVIRRMKSDIRELGPNPDGTPRFPKRVIKEIKVKYPNEERQAHDDLAAYAALRRKTSPSKRSAVAADLITLLLKKRLFSSPAAFAATLNAHIETLAKAGAAGSSSGDLYDLYEQVHSDFESDDEFEDAAFDVLRELSEAGEAITPEQQRLLERMQAWANSAKGQADEKARALIDQIKEWCCPNGPDGKWTNERVIIFTEYRDTQNWLHTLLSAERLAGDRLKRLYGGMNADERERTKAAFQSDPSKDPVRILLATDTASEGIDLQRHCNRMIHVEIPFNPNRLEQRNGRIDRHGQPNPEVYIYHFVGEGYKDKPGSLEADLEFLYRVAHKIETIRTDLGTVGVVLAHQVQSAMLGHGADLDQIKKDKSASAAVLKAERALRERVNEIHTRVLTSQEELGLTPQAIKSVVDIGLDLGRQKKLEEVTLPPKNKRHGDLVAYKVPDLTRSWASAIANLYHPLTGERLPITFDNAEASGREDVVLAHLGSRLVAQSMRLLRAEIWARESEAHLTRFTGRLVPDAALELPVLVAESRLVVMGADGYRLHEQIFAAGGRLGGRGGFARLGPGAVKDALAARGDKLLPQHHQDEIVEAWPRLRDAVFATVKARAEELENGVMTLLKKRADTEIKSLETVMLQLRDSIENELNEAKKGQSVQLSLFDERERAQVLRDLDALERRLKEIPAEVDRDAKRLRRRYATPRQVVFPATVTVLIPKRLADTSLGIFEGSRA